jgi:anti-sigma regulatory factor (Ser/Thr protein kinase)
MSHDLHARVVHDPEHDVVYLTGSLSLANAGTARELLRKTLAERGRVVVDVSALRLEWPPTVELFPTVLRGAGGWPAARLVLCGARGDLERALRLARVPRSVPCEPRLEAAVARLHERPERVVRTRELPCALSSARAARALVADCCTEWTVPELAESGALVVSELVSNAVEHARSSCRATIALDGRSLQVSVRDYGAPFRPRAVPVALDARRGRGLLVVAGICSAWGILVHGDGKTVWATVAPDEGQGASSTQS